MITGMHPRWHGNGFVQVYLNPMTRLHIWNPELPATRVVNAQIHDHKFKFVSRILIGELLHRTWEVHTAPDGLYRRSRLYCGTHDRTRGPTVIDNHVDLKHLHDWRFKKGETYEFGGPNFYHETICDEYTVTVMTKTEQWKDHYPTAVTMWDELPDHAFAPATAVPEEILWKEVRAALRMI